MVSRSHAAHELNRILGRQEELLVLLSTGVFLTTGSLLCSAARRPVSL